MYRLMLICIIVCGALGCGSGPDVNDGGTDVQEDGACGVGWFVGQACRDGVWVYSNVMPDCEVVRMEVVCGGPCADDGYTCAQ